MPSPFEVSLLDSLKRSGYEAAVITTFNAYLPFFEEVVLPRMRSVGCRHVVVLMDASRCAESVSEAHTAPRFAGLQYTLIPVVSRGAFHPKMLLLAGKSRGFLHVGSHNLTLAGFGHNRELSVAFEANAGDEIDSSVLKRAWLAIRNWGERGSNPVGEVVRRSLIDVERLAPWIRSSTTLSAEASILFQSEETSSLLEQLSTHLPARPTRITVMGPFFDTRLQFLGLLAAKYPTCPILVAIDPDTVRVPANEAHFGRYSWRNAQGIAERGGYLHAKALYVEAQGGEDLLVVGSANPSANAWTGSDEFGNDECICFLHGSQARRQAEGLGLTRIPSFEVVPAAKLAEVVKRSKIDIRASEHPSRRVVVASLDEGVLRIPTEGLGKTMRAVEGLGRHDSILWRITELPREGSSVFFNNPQVWAPEVIRLRLLLEDGCEAFAFIHRAAQIADLARTGTQRALRDALEGLHSETGDIAALIATVEKAIFSSEAELARQPSERAGSARAMPASRVETGRPESFAFDLEARRQQEARRRFLRDGGSLAYLIDVLCRELRTERFAVVGLDREGRSEEERIDADDDRDGVDQEKSREGPTDREIAEASRAKVRKLVRRTVAFIEHAASSDKSPVWADAIAKLVAVVAVVREVRSLEHLPRWKVIHERLVDPDDKVELFDGIMGQLFGRETALMRKCLESFEDEAMDEIARLKGMLLWLAWESGVGLAERLGNMDDPDQTEIALLNKAELLAISQFLPGSAISDIELLKSIEKCASEYERRAAATWRNGVQHWITRVERSLGGNVIKFDTVRVGSVAYVTSERVRTLRVVANRTSEYVELFDVGAEHGRHIKFQPDRVVAVQGL